ncbi:MAG: Bro-N domain-containing protein [Nanoarchaeota archaeon]|nr:Bro-N domain-containing protein [Nanoarchaeota archaeon]MBU4351903.1 Bro-N domain-containing protein [Nanoarchaeota archaeon]MBU4456012.1 Bro-N domain-containing protein [Nanoarchaeota archaeon]
METKNKLIVFQGKNIRRIWHNDEWWFSMVDIVSALTESPSPRQYWGVLKGREKQLLTFCLQLKLLSADGKFYATDCANTEGVFRIIQSIPSKKAEPLKLWLAKVGYERVQEIENPELAQKRMKEIYKQKGYSDNWIEKRIRGIAIRDELTDEWDNRGAKTNKEYAILTAEISKATFDLTPAEYKEFKDLKRGNLRDHMDDMELVLTMLGEATTTRFTRERDSQKFVELKKDAKEGGDIAGDTRKNIEKKLGKSVISNDNYLDKPEKEKRKLLKGN